MIFLSALNIVILFVLLRIDRDKSFGNIFSAGAIFIYFALLPALSNFYFSIYQDKLYSVVLSLVAPQFRDLFYVKAALTFTILGNILTYIGIYIGANSRNKWFNFILNNLLLHKFHRHIWGDDEHNDKVNKTLFNFGIITYILGILVYIIFLKKMGGLISLWAEMNTRSTKNAGLGYYQTFYMIAIQLGAIIIIWYSFQNKKKLLRYIIVASTIMIIGSMGARGPVIIFIISTMIMYHFLIKRIKTLINPKYITAIILLPIFIVVMLQLRSNSLSFYLNNKDVLIENSIESFESGFIARVGRLERDIVILKYFTDNDFWWGKSFYGLVYAPIPRSIFPKKPPNDSGMYLRVMALGQKVTPPMPVSQLGSSSWPEWNWVGYMNWGLPGFILFFYFSGLLFGKLFKYITFHKYPVIASCIFSILAVGGPPILSPPGIINLLMFFIVTFILMFFAFLPFKVRIHY
ncbi:O-antigen polymerase [uncultured Sunxiuqinia sp.]|uniref:O-antigen polymerase n=1 Tax=uncultured Sunxiuqinia sp. TaxID=1573825 RepID=UPI002AA7CE8A|nr:O-antigen polymerase [uncultured Sunxiuqinia sp.]